MLSFVQHGFKEPTKETIELKNALERLGVRVLIELDDGHKSIDIAIPSAKMNIEIDGIHHLTNPHQIVADLARGYYSHKLGYDTMHIPNEILRRYLPKIAEGLAEAVRIRERKIKIHFFSHSVSSEIQGSNLVSRHAGPGESILKLLFLGIVLLLIIMALR